MVPRLDNRTGQDTMEYVDKVTNILSLDALGLNSVSLEALAKQLSDLGEKNFSTRYGCSFLVLQHGPTQCSDWIDLNTSEASLPKPSDLANPLSSIRAIPLLKSNRNAFGSKITVGRARNNDVIIRAPKISKLHSSFVIDKDEYRVQDMGSLNGTILNGQRLQNKERALLKNGDLITFWRYVFEYVSYESMLNRIKSA